MLPYLVSFGVVVLICWSIQQWNRRSIGFVFWSCVALIIPCLLAGLRADSIGTDILNYAKPLFELAQNNSTFSSFYNSEWYRIWQYSSPADFEMGYIVLVWVCSKVFNSFQSFLFFTQLLTVLPIYYALARYYSRDVLALGMCVYLFLFYNQSLNMMRQWIGMAFIFLAISGYFCKDIKKNNNRLLAAILIIAFGMMFHTSALLGFALLALSVYIHNGGDRLSRRVAIVCACSIMIIMLLAPIAYMLTSFGFGYYVNYLGSQSIQLMPNQIILRLPMFVYALITYKRGNKLDSQNAFLLCTSFTAISLSQLVSLGENSGRIGLFFDVFNILIPVKLLNTFEERDVRKALIVLSVIAYCLVYWVYFYVISNSGETIPFALYTS